jgi:hypothetical protein
MGRGARSDERDVEAAPMTRPRDRGWLVLLAIAAAFAVGMTPYFVRMYL